METPLIHTDTVRPAAKTDKEPPSLPRPLKCDVITLQSNASNDDEWLEASDRRRFVLEKTVCYIAATARSNCAVRKRVLVSVPLRMSRSAVHDRAFELDISANALGSNP